MSTDWNHLIADLPGTHLLQTTEWANFKSRYGWQPLHRTWKDENGNVIAAATTLIRRISMRGMAANISIAYVPKGPLLDWQDAALRKKVIQGLIQDAKKHGAIFLKMDPEVKLGTGVPNTDSEQVHEMGAIIVKELIDTGWSFARDQIQYRNTVLLDLTRNEEELLAEMKQKTRYNVRLASRRGVKIRAGTDRDFDLLYKMYAETSQRDGFVIRKFEYYKDLWQTFWNAGMLDPIIAEVDGEPIAAIVVFRFAGTAIYMHGMSRRAHRNKMPTYLLQWEAIRRAKQAGCTRYDLWGAPNNFSKHDPMWGVYRFKEGFNGLVTRHIGAWDFPIRPLYFRLYNQILPKILGWMRRRSRDKTRALME